MMSYCILPRNPWISFSILGGFISTIALILLGSTSIPLWLTINLNSFLDTLSMELYQVNVRVGRIARRQVTMGGFAPEPTPSPPHPMASDFDAEDDDDDDDDDGDDNDASDDDGDAISTDEMSA